MGSKANKRSSREAAAKARDVELFQAATNDARTIRYVSSLDETRFQAVQNRALNDARRPMSPHRSEAITVLGAMARVINERHKAGIQPRPVRPE